MKPWFGLNPAVVHNSCCQVTEWFDDPSTSTNDWGAAALDLLHKHSSGSFETPGIDAVCAYLDQATLVCPT